ncbi:MAG: hypothetical protein KGL46_07055 [Hyphomicrobiales bacterium]|nr:hypothetical protein [Hyphomicrobiales bacterium]
MNQKTTQSLALDGFVALAAGLASALAFILSARGASGALTFGTFAPLPLVIGALAFSLWGAVVSSIAGAALLFVLFKPGDQLAIGFLLSVAIPGLVAAAAALLAPVTASADRAPRWTVMAIAFSVAAIVAGALLTAAHMAGGFDKAGDLLTQRFLPLVRTMTAGQALPYGVSEEQLARAFVRSLPAMMTLTAVATFSLNVYAAGRIAALSQRLPRPFPDIARDLTLPPALAALFVIAGALTLTGGLRGVLASIVTGALGMAFAMQGLAYVHFVTRGSSARFAILLAIYLAIFALQLLPLTVIALLGLADCIFLLRKRKANNSSSDTEDKGENHGSDSA